MPLLKTPRRKTRRLSFAGLLAPMIPTEFFDSYWEQHHLIVRQAQAQDPPLFSFADVDRYISIAASDPAAHLSVGVAGQPIRTMRIRDLDIRQLYQAFHQGCTVMLGAIDRCWPPVAELAAEFREALDAEVKVNVYMTPPGFQGAPIHPDIQDVFVLQMEGRKDWFVYEEKIYEPVENLTYASELAPPHVHFAEEPALAERAVLEKGDLLYIPRGLAHRAVAPEDSPSLHLTVCVTPFYWVDFLKAALEIVSAENPELSRSLKPGFGRDPATGDAMRKAFSATMSLFAEKASFQRTADLLHRTRTSSRPYPADGHFGQLLQLDEIDLDTPMERRPGLSCLVEIDDESAYLRFSKAEVKAAAKLAPALEFVRDHQRFRAGDLPESLSAKSKLVLIRRLVRDGLLRADFAPEEASGAAPRDLAT